MMRNLYIVDDDDAERGALRALVEQPGDLVLRGFKGSARFAEQLPELDPGVVLLAIAGAPPGADALALLEAGSLAPAPGRAGLYPVVAIARADDVGPAVRAMKAGSLDVLIRPVVPEGLVEALVRAFDLLRDGLTEASQVADARDRVATLSPREHDVLTGLIAGQPNKSIAIDLSISPRTVEIYRANLMSKLDAKSLPDALRVALAAGLA